MFPNNLENYINSLIHFVDTSIYFIQYWDQRSSRYDHDFLTTEIIIYPQLENDYLWFLLSKIYPDNYENKQDGGFIIGSSSEDGLYRGNHLIINSVSCSSRMYLIVKFLKIYNEDDARQYYNNRKELSKNNIRRKMKRSFSLKYLIDFSLLSENKYTNLAVYKGTLKNRKDGSIEDELELTIFNSNPRIPVDHSLKKYLYCKFMSRLDYQTLIADE